MKTLSFNNQFCQILTEESDQIQTKAQAIFQLIIVHINSSFRRIQESTQCFLDIIREEQIQAYHQHVYEIKHAKANINYLVKTLYEYLSCGQSSQRQEYTKYFCSKLLKLQKMAAKDKYIVNEDSPFFKEKPKEASTQIYNDESLLIQQLNSYGQFLPIYRFSHCLHPESIDGKEDIDSTQKQINQSISSAINKMIKRTTDDLDEFNSIYAFEANEQYSEIMNILNNQYKKININHYNIPSIEELNNMKELCLNVKVTIQQQKKRIKADQQSKLKVQHGSSSQDHSHSNYHRR